jgi:hypothetical protein
MFKPLVRRFAIAYLEQAANRGAAPGGDAFQQYVPKFRTKNANNRKFPIVPT